MVRRSRGRSVRTVNIVVVMDLDPKANYHTATIAAIDHASTALGFGTAVRAIRTAERDLDKQLARADGIVIGPGSPYQDEQAVWDTVRGAREKGVPLVGT